MWSRVGFGMADAYAASILSQEARSRTSVLSREIRVYTQASPLPLTPSSASLTVHPLLMVPARPRRSGLSGSLLLHQPPLRIVGCQTSLLVLALPSNIFAIQCQGKSWWSGLGGRTGGWTGWVGWG